ncbi:MAG TPA: Na+/H+ antiporter [Thermoanaerobaculia bacterium]|nr:Na+/H+ antiporter [Thermoanaerobaculia bacterium]
MKALELVLVLLAATAALNLLADRLVVPPPVLLVLGGALLAVIPGLPRAILSPDVIFLVFVPPLLYWAAFNTSWRDFRANLRSISLLSVGLVLATMAAIAAVSHVLAPELTWPAAFALGAIVSPPDPVAVTAVTRRLGIPRDIVTVLEGEGLLNDATALVAYRMAVAAVVAGGFSLGEASLRFLWAAVAGIGVGLAVGWAIIWIRCHVRDTPVISNTVSILTPFAAFIPAERIGASGVLSVVAVGLYIARRAPRVVTPQTRTQAIATWQMIVFFLEGVVFILIGLELPLVVAGLHAYSIRTLVLLAAAVSGTAILARMIWVFPAAYIGRLLRRLLGRGDRIPPWRGIAFVGWAGLRGGDSLVIALSLPLTVGGGAKFPGRDLILFLTFSVIFVTLVLQGLTLKPVIRLLGLKADPKAAEEETMARSRMADAGLESLRSLPAEGPSAQEALAALEEKHRHRAHRYGARLRGQRHNRDEARTEAYRRLRLGMIGAERDALLKMRDEDEISDEVMRALQNDLDLEQVLLESPEATQIAMDGVVQET